MKKQFLAWIVCCLSLWHCKHEPQETPEPACNPVSFTGQIQPIIQVNCAITNCHVAGSPDGNFNNFADLKEKIDNGSFKNSVIDWNAPRMPEAYKLPEAELRHRVVSCCLGACRPQPGYRDHGTSRIGPIPRVVGYRAGLALR